MLKIRLTRLGRKKQPTYRIVVANATSPRDGKFLEIVGNYNPMLKNENEPKFNLNIERLVHWLETGAQPTERVCVFISKLEDERLNKFKAKFQKKNIKAA
jgi:small subunit ribosomal protein S16